MSSRGLEFLAHPDEFYTVLKGLVEKLGLYVIVRMSYSEPSLLVLESEEISPTLKNEDILLIFLSKTEPERLPNTLEMNPAKSGWVTFWPPMESNSFLYEGSLGARSDWWDEENNKVLENKDGLKLFETVKRGFKKFLKNPVWIASQSSFEPVQYKTIWFMESARNHVEEGKGLALCGGLGALYLFKDLELHFTGFKK